GATAFDLRVLDDDEIYGVILPAGALHKTSSSSFSVPQANRPAGVKEASLRISRKGEATVTLRTGRLDLAHADRSEHMVRITLEMGTYRTSHTRLWRLHGHRLAPPGAGRGPAAARSGGSFPGARRRAAHRQPVVGGASPRRRPVQRAYRGHGGRRAPDARGVDAGARCSARTSHRAGAHRTHRRRGGPLPRGAGPRTRSPGRWGARATGAPGRLPRRGRSGQRRPRAPGASARPRAPRHRDPPPSDPADAPRHRAARSNRPTHGSGARWVPRAPRGRVHG